MTETTPRMSPLGRRMIDDMTVRNLSPATQRSYLHAVAKFSRLAKAVAHRAKKRSLVPPHPAR